MQNRQINIRLSESELTEIKNIANKEKISLSSLLLNSVLNGKRKTEKKIVFEFINKLSFDYTKIATNVNQIAKFVNSQEYLTEQQALELKNLLLEFNKLKLEQITLLREFQDIIGEW